jgi:peroxiredoxin
VSRSTRRRILPVAAALLLACWMISTALAGESLAPVPGKPMAPDFSLVDLEGRTHRLGDYLGHVLIVNFWATWCPPCRDEMPSLNIAWERLRGAGVEVLAINVGEDEDSVFTFTATYPVGFPLLLDSDASVVERWPVLGLPTTFVVDKQGRLIYRAVGARAWDDPEILALIRQLAE